MDAHGHIRPAGQELQHQVLTQNWVPFQPLSPAFIPAIFFACIGGVQDQSRVVLTSAASQASCKGLSAEQTQTHPKVQRGPNSPNT